MLDADERLTPELTSEIRRVMAAPPDNIDGYSIARLYHYLGRRIKRCGWDADRVIRLFRRDASRYKQRRVHAELKLDSRRVALLLEPMLHFTTWTTDQYVEKLNRYAGWGALNACDESRRAKPPNLLSLFFTAPLRFLQLYFVRLGFLDGVPGFQVCMFAAFYSFMSNAFFGLWRSAIAASGDSNRQRKAALRFIVDSLDTFPRGRTPARFNEARRPWRSSLDAWTKPSTPDPKRRRSARSTNLDG